MITGGSIVAFGTADMADTFDDTSTQYSILYFFDETVEAGTEVTLSDSDGNVIMSYTAEKSGQSVVFSSPDITEGTYTITAGEQSAKVTVSEISTSAGTKASSGRGGDQGGKPSGRNGSKGPGAFQDSDSAGTETSEGTDAADTKTSTD